MSPLYYCLLAVVSFRAMFLLKWEICVSLITFQRKLKQNPTVRA